MLIYVRIVEIPMCHRKSRSVNTMALLGQIPQNVFLVFILYLNFAAILTRRGKQLVHIHSGIRRASSIRDRRECRNEVFDLVSCLRHPDNGCSSAGSTVSRFLSIVYCPRNYRSFGAATAINHTRKLCLSLIHI